MRSSRSERHRLPYHLGLHGGLAARGRVSRCDRRDWHDALSDSIPTLVLTVKTPPSLNKLWITVRNKRIRSPEYRTWLREAGWQIRQQIVGMPIIECRYDMEIQVPVSRRDSGNYEKALGDCLEAVGVVTNDGNVHKLTVTPIAGRTDCSIGITPHPEMNGVRPQAKVYPNKGYVRPKVRKKGITSAMIVGVKV